MPPPTRLINPERSAPFAVLLCSLFALALHCPSAGADVGDLLDLSLEDLAQTPVALVSRKAEDPHVLPAAVSVLTAEDLQHTGALNLADALRLVPGFHVGRVDANKWAVSARGFNGRFANKLLVLVDGRSVYTPLASGVYWEMQDVFLADLERVEVIRGPGAALWGANAVNGVVNLVSKDAASTQGGALRVGAGSEERLFVQGRYGGRISARTHYRLYGHFAQRDDLKRADGIAAYDGWDAWKAGARIDWQPAPCDRISIGADLQQGDMAQTALLFTPQPPYSQFDQHRIEFSSFNTSWQWQRILSEHADFTLFSYFEHLERRGPPIGELSNIWNSELQHRFRVGDHHELLWGGGYRLTEIERTSDTFTASLSPRVRHLSLFEGFVQDDIALITNRLRLLLGAKLEHHEFTGWEFQPNARLAWTPTPQHTLWTAASRAVRSSSRGENDIRVLSGVFPPFGDGQPTFIGLVGNRDFRAEKLRALELGYRYRLRDSFSVDVATFVNTYDELRSLEGVAPLDFAEYSLIPFTAGNLLSGRSHGLEITGHYAPTKNWSIDAIYSYYKLDLTLDPTSTDIISLEQEHVTPTHILSLSLQRRNVFGVDLGGSFRRVGAVAAHDIDSYNELDLRLSRRVTADAQLTLFLHNILHATHGEYAADFVLVPQMRAQRAFALVLQRAF